MPGGQPTKYSDKFPRMAYVACVEGGFSDLKLSKLFGCSKSTINNWKKEHPEFLDSIVAGKDEFDCLKAEDSLLKRVNGARYTETTKELIKNPDFDISLPEDKKTNPKMILAVTKKVSKYIPPDTQALRFFLPNRARNQRWKLLKHVEVSGPDGGSISIESTQKARKQLLDEVDGSNAGLPSAISPRD